MKLEHLSKYIIEKNGKVLSLASNKYLKPHDRGNGYLQYRMYDDSGKQIAITAHRLVALAYLPNKLNKPTVNHKNRIKSDNHVDNLEWATQQEQVIHSISSGFKPNTSGIGKGGLLSGKSRPVTNGIKVYVTATDAEKDGFNRNLISQVCRGLRSHHKKLKWSFIDKESLVC